MGRLLGVIVIAIIIIGGAWYLLSSPSGTTSETATSTTETTATTTTTTTSINPQSQNITISYTDQGFSPKTASIPQGATVTFVNNSSEAMWVASNPHPVHTGYDGTSETTHCAAGYTGPAPFDECTQASQGGTFSFTFTKVGTWGYHNHADHSMTGSITVTAPVENGGINGTVNVTASTTVQ